MSDFANVKILSHGRCHRVHAAYWSRSILCSYSQFLFNRLISTSCQFLTLTGETAHASPIINETQHNSDLAQIHLREGDLQRINGNYISAVGDYSICLETLLKHNHTKDEKNNIRNLGRKIADTQYNLGLTYLTSSSDIQKQVADADIENSDMSINTKEQDEAAQHRKKATILANEHCEKGIQLYFDCARTFCNIVANICGIDSETILLSSTESTKNDTIKYAKKPPAGLKTTGLYDGGIPQKIAASTHTEVSKTLNTWRMAVKTLVKSHHEGENAPRLLDIVQVLDEIQEIIDEAERSQEGVLQAAKIRVKAQQAAAALKNQGAAVAKPDGSITTIGFGPEASLVAASATANAVASRKPQDAFGSSKAIIADIKSMMVVKKKRKRISSHDDGRHTKKTSQDSDAISEKK